MDINDELISLGNSDKAAFVQSLLEKECPLESLGISIPTIRKLANKYTPEDIENLTLNRYTEANIFYFLVMLKPLTLEEQMSLLIKKPYINESWAITDTIQNAIKIKTTEDIVKILPLKEAGSYSRRLFYVLLMRFKKQWDEISPYIEDDPGREVYTAVAGLLQGCYVYRQDDVLNLISSFSPVTKRVLLSKIKDSRKISKEDKEKAAFSLKRS